MSTSETKLCLALHTGDPSNLLRLSFLVDGI